MIRGSSGGNSLILLATFWGGYTPRDLGRGILFPRIDSLVDWTRPKTRVVLPCDWRIGEMKAHPPLVPGISSGCEICFMRNEVPKTVTLQSSLVLGCPRKLGSMVGKRVITYLEMGYIGVITHLRTFYCLSGTSK